MGCSRESKAYILFKPEDYGILISPDVVFLEESKTSLKRKTDFYYSELVQAYGSIDSGESSTEIESATENETDESCNDDSVE